jgi:hypothetical protein
MQSAVMTKFRFRDRPVRTDRNRHRVEIGRFKHRSTRATSCRAGANRRAAGLAGPLRPDYKRNVSSGRRNNPVGDAAEAFWRDARREFVMLAEKFILLLESLIRSQSRSYPESPCAEHVTIRAAHLGSGSFQWESGRYVLKENASLPKTRSAEPPPR